MVKKGALFCCTFKMYKFFNILPQYFRIFCIFNNSFLKVISFGFFNQPINLVPFLPKKEKFLVGVWHTLVVLYTAPMVVSLKQNILQNI